MFLFIISVLTLVAMFIYNTITLFNYKYEINFENDRHLITHIFLNSIFKYTFIYFFNLIAINFLYPEYKNLKILNIIKDFRLYLLLCFLNIITCTIYYIFKKIKYKT